MAEVGSPEERTALWRAAVETLAKLHRVDFEQVGLAGFGSKKGRNFYPRQVETWKAICRAQSRSKDADSGKEVGPLPRMDELVAFFAEERRWPKDRVTVVHGDYKIDNMVFHKTEPRVIGILE